MNSLDAEQARKAIAATTERARAFHAYATMGPAIAVWGGVWLVTYLIRAAQLPSAGLVGGAALLVGIVASVLTGLKGRAPSPTGRKAQTVGAAFGGLLLAVATVVSPLDPHAAGAVIGLIIAGAYGVAGLIAAPRLALLGLALALTVLAAWFGLRAWFDLVLGLAGGGALIAGGLWLWRQ